MEKKLKKSFIEASKAFKKSKSLNQKASNESVEKLFDIIYELKKKERSDEENFVLADIYSLLDRYIDAFRILDSASPLSRKKQEKYAKKIVELERKRRKKNNNFCYRDLREARIIKKPTKLSVDDFILESHDDCIQIKIKDDIKRVVMFNKYIKSKEVSIFAIGDIKKLDIVIDCIHWLGACKEELITFYNQTKIEGKVDKADNEWFDGLDVSMVHIIMKKNGMIEGDFAVSDYINYNYGFHLFIENKTITHIEYDAGL